MTPDNYASIQRNLGLLEGLVGFLPELQQQLAYGAIETLDHIIDEMQKGEGGKT